MSPRTVLVIGAGAAGLTAALRAAQSGAAVTALNAHPKVGLKILMSGGTRCNVTHRAVTERDFHGGSPNVVKRVLRAFTVPQTLAWFQDELGVPLQQGASTHNLQRLAKGMGWGPDDSSSILRVYETMLRRKVNP